MTTSDRSAISFLAMTIAVVGFLTACGDSTSATGKVIPRENSIAGLSASDFYLQFAGKTLSSMDRIPVGDGSVDGRLSVLIGGDGRFTLNYTEVKVTDYTEETQASRQRQGGWYVSGSELILAGVGIARPVTINRDSSRRRGIILIPDLDLVSVGLKGQRMILGTERL